VQVFADFGCGKLARIDQLQQFGVRIEANVKPLFYGIFTLLKNGVYEKWQTPSERDVLEIFAVSEINVAPLVP